MSSPPGRQASQIRPRLPMLGRWLIPPWADPPQNECPRGALSVRHGAGIFYNDASKTIGGRAAVVDLTLVVEPNGADMRLDQFIADHSRITRSQAQKLIETGEVRVQNRYEKKNYRVRTGDVISIRLPEREVIGLVPQNIPLQVVYQDRYVVVINKPHGMVMYPGAGHAQGTLMNGIAFLSDTMATVGAPLRPGVVHRLDKDTSGIVVIALTDEAYYGLQHQFRARTVLRNYVSLIYGRLSQAAGTIEAEIGRARSDRKKMSTRTRAGKKAVTHYSVIEVFREATLVRVKLDTGRTHQIRVHFASVGHPVLGDSSYGGKIYLTVKGTKLKIPRQMLHAQTLGFTHPVTDEPLEFSAPLPADMASILSLLRDAAGLPPTGASLPPHRRGSPTANR